MKGWHIGFAVIVVIVLLGCATLAWADTPPSVVCDDQGRLSVHLPGVVYRITRIRCELLDDA